MPAPLLTTRFESPSIRPNLVPRPRLIGQLNAGLSLDHRLILVAAPAGFGKTTLLGEWITALERPVAWLSIDEGGNDPLAFFRYLVAALQQVDDGLGRTVQPLLLSPPPASEESLMTALINDLAGGKGDLLLVLDDYHAITSYTVHDMLSFLLENRPAGFHLVIGTREDPPLPLARLRARGQVTEIRERSLRFTLEEAGSFLNETMRLALSADHVSALESRTEGWAAGLQLAALALQEEPDAQRAQAFIAAFTGDDRYVMDYLMAEVLQRQPAEIQDFLRQTSILERLTASLCEALRGDMDEQSSNALASDSQAILEHLERSNLFIIPLDHRREWYRYHRLFAEVLRATLSVEEEQQLHRRAAEWYEAHDYAFEARQHSLAYNLAFKPPRPALEQPLIESLSERELEVLGLIAAGLKNREIAQRLYITTGTVKRHTNHIYGKLGVHSRTAAVARGRELGLL